MVERLEIVTLTQAAFSCKIAVNYGAALCSYTFQGKEFIDGYQLGTETIQQKYKGVLLAPFPNRVAKAIYTYEGQSYTLPINREKESLALHGYLYNKVFEVVHCTENQLVLKYSCSNSEFEGYPFSFDVEVVYNLDKNGCLEIITEVHNTSQQEIPMGIGWHPYFRIDDSIDGMSLDFPTAKQLEIDAKLIPTENLLAYTNKQTRLNLFDHQFDDCFQLELVGENQFILLGKQHSLTISTPGLDHYPYFQIYTPKDRRSIAIEPMTCAPNAFNNGMGLTKIKSKERVRSSYSIQARKH